jgi:hypothetical protein
LTRSAVGDIIIVFLIEDKEMKSTYNIFARQNVIICGQEYITGFAIRTVKGKLKTFKKYESAANYCRSLFGAQWPSVLEIS